MPYTPLHQELSRLPSEARNPHTMNLDALPTLVMLERINQQDQEVPQAVARTLPQIAAAVEKIVAAFQQGGRLIYQGAGTSGRLGVLDASECPPTFGVPPGWVVGLIAGGEDALTRALEGAEDDEAAGQRDLEAIGCCARDVLVGIAVSGRTPYVIGGLRHARAVGATSIALACNPDCAMAKIADIAILPVVGPEVLTGSTRLKAGTAQKLVLNMLSTASMVRLGRVYQNLMVDLRASNQKLRARAERIICEASGCTLDAARAALTASGGEVKLAILLQISGLPLDAARQKLSAADGVLRRALEPVHSLLSNKAKNAR